MIAVDELIAAKSFRTGRPGARVPVFSVTVVGLLVLCGVFGRFLTLHDPEAGDLSRALMPPAWMAGGSWEYPLGADELGRDILSRLVGGARIVLEIGFTAVVLAGVVGLLVAVVAGYFRGWTESVLMRLTDAMLSMPFMLVALTLATALGTGKTNLIATLAVMFWAGYARVLRGEVLRIRESQFVRLAIVGGCSSTRILIRHVVPNLLNSFIVLATLQLGITIVAAATLSFLGLGIPPPAPDWGTMLASGRGYIDIAWWLSVWPGVAITVTVLAINLLGEWVRVRLDPKYRGL